MVSIFLSTNERKLNKTEKINKNKNRWQNDNASLPRTVPFCSTGMQINLYSTSHHKK